MTKTQTVLVKNSWKVLRAIDPVLIGDVFYGKLFLEYPKLETVFRQPGERQSVRLIDTVSMLVSRIDDLSALLENTRDLALRQAQYAVKNTDYEALGKTLLWTLEKALGSDWNEELAQAWTACYNTISAAMTGTADPGQKQEQEQKQTAPPARTAPVLPKQT